VRDVHTPVFAQQAGYAPPWPIAWEHPPFALSSKRWRASLVIHPGLQLLCDFVLVVLVHIAPFCLSLWLEDKSFVEAQVGSSTLDGRAKSEDWVANVFLWFTTAHLYLVLGVAVHELASVLVDVVHEARAQLRDWQRAKPGRRCCATCKCLCHRRRIDRVLFEQPIVMLEGQLFFNSALHRCGGRCDRFTGRCKTGVWRRCKPFCALFGLLLVIGASLFASGFAAHLDIFKGTTTLAEFMSDAGEWVPTWLGLLGGMLLSGTALRILVKWRCTLSPRIATAGYVLFAIVSLVAMLFTQMSVTAEPYPDVMEPCFKLQLDPTEKSETEARYAICDSKWYGLTASEISVLASILAYKPPSEFLMNTTRTFFPGWEYVGGSVRGSQPMWQEFYNAGQNVSMINIMGTSTWGDFFYDMQIWGSTFFINFLLRPLLPFSDLFTSAATTSIFKVATSGTPVPHVFLDVSSGIEQYLQPVIDYAQTKAHGGQLFFTGHSLGGGLAKALAARLNTFAVSFEGPGVVHPFVGLFYDNLKWSPEWSRWNGNTNVRAQGDLVAFVGEDIGYTQEVTCRGFDRLPLVSCHLTIASVLLHNCQTGNQFARMAATQPVGHQGALHYCPGLPDRLPNPLPPGMTMVETPRNRYSGAPEVEQSSGESQSGDSAWLESA